MTEVPLRNIRLLIAYDGTDFHGWQRQAKQRSVQGDLEAALAKIHKHELCLIGSGRTDSGVHASGQVAHFYTDIASMPESSFVPALNTILRRDVRVLAASRASDDFHSRFDAKSRTYRYSLICGRSALPGELRYAWQLWRRPRLSRLNALASVLLGERDCSLFAVPSDPSESRQRLITLSRFHVEGATLIYEIRANAFLWKMVRSIVGTLLRCEELDLSPDAFAALVKSGERAKAGPTAPPQGLSLHYIDFYRL